MGIFESALARLLNVWRPHPGDDSWRETLQGDNRLCLDCGQNTEVVRSGRLVEYDVCKTDSCQNGGAYRFTSPNYLYVAGVFAFVPFVVLALGSDSLVWLIAGLMFSILSIQYTNKLLPSLIAEVSD